MVAYWDGLDVGPGQIALTQEHSKSKIAFHTDRDMQEGDYVSLFKEELFELKTYKPTKEDTTNPFTGMVLSFPKYAEFEKFRDNIPKQFLKT